MDRQELKMHVQLLRKLWDAIASRDEFTDEEKHSVLAELQIAEERYDAIHETSAATAEAERLRKDARAREQVLNGVFSDAPVDCKDYMRVFVVEQERLMRARETGD